MHLLDCALVLFARFHVFSLYLLSVCILLVYIIYGPTFSIFYFYIVARNRRLPKLSCPHIFQCTCPTKSLAVRPVVWECELKACWTRPTQSCYKSVKCSLLQHIGTASPLRLVAITRSPGCQARTAGSTSRGHYCLPVFTLAQYRAYQGVVC